MADLGSEEPQENEDKLRLLDMPTEMLLCILNFCDVLTLRKLSLTCKRLNNLVSLDCLWIKQSKSAIITNQISNQIKER